MRANRGLTTERMAGLGRVSRPGFYRHLAGRPASAKDSDTDFRDAIQRIALA